MRYKKAEQHNIVVSADFKVGYASRPSIASYSTLTSKISPDTKNAGRNELWRRNGQRIIFLVSINFPSAIILYE
jgi:hypothetical protein